MHRRPSRHSARCGAGPAAPGRFRPRSPTPAPPPGAGRETARSPAGGAVLVSAAALALLLATTSARAGAQSEAYTLRGPGGATLSFPGDTVRAMLQRTRRRQSVLEEDPDVLYYVGTRGEVTGEDPAPAYPWNAVRVESDSVARIAVPGNYREAGRAYRAYAVETMERIRGERPAADCSRAVQREREAVSAFVDGWIVARTLYGGPAFPPLDALAFAREAGHLGPMLVALGDTRIGGCVRSWSRQHPGAMEAYRAWRSDFDARAAPSRPSGR